MRYTVAEPAAPGPGLAFSTPFESHLLNVRAGSISLNPTDAGEFAQWRSAHRGDWEPLFRHPELGWGDYPPRRLFGLYAQSVWDATASEAAGRGQSVTVVDDGVIRIVDDPATGRWTATFASGATHVYDRVLLALGHLPSSTYPGLVATSRYLASPWEPRDIPDDATVGVIGTRLTAIDAALALHEVGHRGRVTLASRTGWLPSVRGPVVEHGLRHVPDAVADCEATGRRLDLSAIADLVRREIREVETREIDWRTTLTPPPTTRESLAAELAEAESGRAEGWQSVLSALVPYVSSLWQVADEGSRTRFLAHHLSAWAIRVAPFPAISARRLLDAMDRGMLSVTAGLTGVGRGTGDGYRLLRSGEASIDVDWLINGTGPGFGSDSLAGNPLTRQLIGDGLAVPHPYGGVRVHETSYQVLDGQGVELPGVYALGDLTRGTWIATNAVQNTVAQAAVVARLVAQSLVAEHAAAQRVGGADMVRAS